MKYEVPAFILYSNYSSCKPLTVTGNVFVVVFISLGIFCSSLQDFGEFLSVVVLSSLDKKIFSWADFQFAIFYRKHTF